MDKINMGRFKAILLVVFLFLGAGIANATVLDFEDLNGLTGGTGGSGYVPGIDPLPSGYGGFTWSIGAAWVHRDYAPGSGYEYGTLGYTSLFTAFAYSIAMISAAPFDFNGAYITAAFYETEDVLVTGYVLGGPNYVRTVTVNNDGPTWFDFNFLNVYSVDFLPGGLHIVIDNITYNQTRVPEPATMLLFGAGLVGLFAGRRMFKR